MEEKPPSAAGPCVTSSAWASRCFHSPGDTSRDFPQGPADFIKEADLQGKGSILLAETLVRVCCPRKTINPFRKWVLLSKCRVINNTGNLGDDNLNTQAASCVLDLFMNFKYFNTNLSAAED